MKPLLFTPRWSDVDKQLVAAAQRHGSTAATLADVEQQGIRPLLLEQIVRPDTASNVPTHLGKMARLLWHWVYDTFVGHSVVEHPAGFGPKCVLLADVYVTPLGGDRKAHLAVRAEDGPPILVPFPWLPRVLLR